MSLPTPTQDSSPMPAPTAKGKRRRLRLLLAATGLLIVSALLLTRKPVPAPVVKTYTVQEARTAQAHMDAVRAQLETPQIPQAQPQSAPHVAPAKSQAAPHAPRLAEKASTPPLVRIQLSQADLNAYLATNPQAKAMLTQKGVTAIQVLLIPPHGLTFRATLLYKGQPNNIQVETQVRAGRNVPVQITATSAQVGRLPLPSVFITAETNKVAASLAGRMQGRLPFVVRDVEVVKDHLVLVGEPLSSRKN